MYKWMNIVMDDERVHSLAKSLPSLFSNLWWNIAMDDQNLDEKSLGKQHQLHHCKPTIPLEYYKEWQNNVGLIISVGDTTP